MHRECTATTPQVVNWQPLTQKKKNAKTARKSLLRVRCLVNVSRLHVITGKSNG